MPKRICFQIPDEHLTRVAEAVVTLYPIPVDDKTGAPLYTADEWIDEKLRQTPIDWVFLFEKRQAAKTAVEAVERDDQVITLEPAAL